MPVFQSLLFPPWSYPKTSRHKIVCCFSLFVFFFLFLLPRFYHYHIVSLFAVVVFFFPIFISLSFMFFIHFMFCFVSFSFFDQIFFNLYDMMHTYTRIQNTTQHNTVQSKLQQSVVSKYVYIHNSHLRMNGNMKHPFCCAVSHCVDTIFLCYCFFF